MTLPLKKGTYSILSTLMLLPLLLESCSLQQQQKEEHTEFAKVFREDETTSLLPSCVYDLTINLKSVVESMAERKGGPLGRVKRN